MIELTDLTKVYGHGEERTRKTTTAKKTRQDDRLVLLVRTDHFGKAVFDDADRCK